MPTFSNPDTGLRDWRSDDVHFRREDGFWVPFLTLATFFVLVGGLLATVVWLSILR
jgi:hypothetical protein